MRCIAKSSNITIIGIPKTKLNITVFDSDITVEGYNIVLNKRNLNGGGIVCYIRNNICYNRKTCISDNIENILFLKAKPILVGIINKPTSQTHFLEQMITEFDLLDLNNEIYILGDFNINLLLTNKCIINKPNKTR